ncbi:phosphoesterase [Candidatus Woesearchaeota archaeon CG11_big_fil_rev_8_21_14_0_20_43_8]|nr:MAG: phosphoesterase [Candidatus Woesearchaeota archaeon CG11_big_fil_rev_8_21_14_0_20_43_8]PIO06738.1 MAG: phosphoesterase [Candidatus Woesearchaeota archaeon CG08_land_8_20_14_0_20_43_7]
MAVDLHTHTIMSDGTDTPEEIVMKAKSLGVTALAITDHDTIEGIKRAIEAGKKRDVRIIPGIEFSLEFKGDDLHILGLGFDPDSCEISRLLQQMQKTRTERALKILENLRKIGIDICIGFVRSLAHCSINRGHIAEALVRKGFVKNREDAFQKFLIKGRPAYHERIHSSIKKVIDVIHGSGGIAVVAHPCLYKNLTPADFDEMLRSYAFDGIEVYYPASSADQTYFFLDLAKRFSLLVSLGSDYHGKNRDVELGCIRDSENLAGPILERLDF